MDYHNRDEEVRATISKDEAIRLIEEVYHARCDPDKVSFDVWDQLLACEAIAESTQIKTNYYKERETTNENGSVNGMVIGTCKRDVKFELIESKQAVIEKLKTCNHETSRKEIESLLEELFRGYGTNDGHWLYVAQHWNPRAINRVLNKMIKRQSSGQETIINPAAYFTERIKHRKKRRDLISTNGTCKHQEKVRT